mmetsp:Transcript_40851/g.85520  ORF Transcript_40851/g.85520 Transcript_40851/m.85520 type:complete len:207 (-) Transcript_40851:507-1127(-)
MPRRRMPKSLPPITTHRPCRRPCRRRSLARKASRRASKKTSASACSGPLLSNRQKETDRSSTTTLVRKTSTRSRLQPSRKPRVQRACSRGSTIKKVPPTIHLPLCEKEKNHKPSNKEFQHTKAMSMRSFDRWKTTAITCPRTVRWNRRKPCRQSLRRMIQKNRRASRLLLRLSKNWIFLHPRPTNLVVRRLTGKLRISRLPQQHLR